MSGEEVTRNEFNGAIEGIRRELKAMGETLEKQLAQILRQLDAMNRSTSEDSKKVATLEARMELAEKRLDSAQTTARMLMVGLATSLVGHLLRLFGGR